MSANNRPCPQPISTQARIICGNGSTGNRGDQHRAIAVARQLHAIGAWDGQRDIIIHRPHDLHREVRFGHSRGTVRSITVWGGIYDLEDGVDYEVDSGDDPGDSDDDDQPDDLPEFPDRLTCEGYRRDLDPVDPPHCTRPASIEFAVKTRSGSIERCYFCGICAASYRFLWRDRDIAEHPLAEVAA